MESRLELDILPQPDDTTCGPTCLHAVYRYYGDDIPLRQVIDEVPALQTGGTIGVLLGCHALARGYDVRIHTYNLQAFDPTWFAQEGVDLADRLRRQRQVKTDAKLHISTAGYLEFLERGGEVRFEDLSSALIRRYLGRHVPILTGLSSTYLYRGAREAGPDDVPDDIRGTPSGHFVVLEGYDREDGVLIADPFLDNPADSHHYQVRMERVICAILLGVLTYDANLLVIRPKGKGRDGAKRWPI
jgi:hypothetical protein